MSLLTKKREEAKLSMTEVASRAKMDLSKLSRLEHGHLKLKADDIVTLAKAMGCKPGDLLPDIDDEPSAITPTPEEVLP